jgi:hypothetical protein
MAYADASDALQRAVLAALRDGLEPADVRETVEGMLASLTCDAKFILGVAGIRLEDWLEEVQAQGPLGGAGAAGGVVKERRGQVEGPQASSSRSS